jgi:Fe-S cluster biogenesis protein NfuA/nitrite reductase/ring-hydroxylating ferredoxin subunit
MVMVQAPASHSIHQPAHQPTDHADAQAVLDALIDDIRHYETIISAWDESQQATVSGFKRAIEALHREALVRLIRTVKQESMLALRQAVEDELVYGLLRYHELIKPPAPPLAQRIEMALAEVRPGLKGHSGDVELVAIHPPDTVEVRLIGACSHCPASSLTLSQGVEEAIKRYCPEIQRVIATESSSHSPQSSGMNSPFAPDWVSDWLEVTSLAEVPQGRLLAMKLAGKSLLLTRLGETVVCYHNACSHLGVPLDGGELHQEMHQEGHEPGGQTILTCPYHGFRYCLTTGACLTSPETPLQSYPVEVRAGQVFVKLGA